MSESNKVNQILSKPSRLGINRERGERLVFFSLLQGIYLLLTTSLFALDHDFKYWPFVALAFTLFFVGWSFVYRAQKNSHQNSLWALGIIVVLSTLLCSGVILISLSAPETFWPVWGFGILIGLGFIPWAVFQVWMFVFVISSFATYVIFTEPLGLWGLFLHLSVIYGLWLAIRGNRKLNQRYLIGHFHESLTKCRNVKDCLRVLADYLSSLLEAPLAIISFEEIQTNLQEIVIGEKLQSFSEEQFSLREFRTLQKDLLISETGFALKNLVNLSLPIKVELSGSKFSIKNGILLGFSLDKKKSSMAEDQNKLYEISPSRSEVDEMLILIGLKFPLMRHLKRSELSLLEAVSVLALNRIETFRERELAKTIEEQAESRLKERDYEMNSLVHDVNNTVQDMTLLCDVLIEDLVGKSENEEASKLLVPVKRISAMSRSVSILVSDAKRSRELEKQLDLFPRETIEIGEVLEEIIEFASIRADRRRIKVIYGKQLGDDIWCKFSAREYLETVIRNLLNNAILYSSPGSEVVVGLEIQNNQACLSIRDQGPGLSQEEQNQLFQIGFRGKSSVGHSGLGLGLAHSKRVLLAANGSIEVFSAGAGKGATFTVKLPICRAPSSSTLKARTGNSWALVVDDETSLTEFYSRVARALWFDPTIAMSLDEAEKAISIKGQPGFVITDLHLGNTTNGNYGGLELIKILRGKFGTNVPIVVVSGQDDEKIEEQVIAVGANGYLKKPIGRKTLFLKIQELLERADD
jgi:signal transduction histidine kinase/CheY-like chemotaxis protein